PQMLGRRTFSYPRAVDGCRQMLWGFFKKMVIADNCALAVDTIWQDYSSMNGTTMAVGAILFTFQIYCDFSGYSDIAIGTARLFGINLMQNFRMPYFSRNIAEFWRRWHISLMTWFRDYVYIPLGGSRRGRWITLRNTLTVFALSGLWHGANWTYVCWGLYHAVLFVPIILVSKSRKFADEPQLCIADVCRMLLTFLLVVFGWIIFRAPSMSQAVDYIVHLAASMADSPLTIMHGKAALLYSAVIVAAEWMQRRHPHALHFAGWMGAAGAKTTVARYAVYLLIATAIILLRGEAQTFIYFQF
ncbi:MAG: MBOAT family protein, partial [Prevotella sp.]|nr:MBOAT family protein [Prevotella sp.]